MPMLALMLTIASSTVMASSIASIRVSPSQSPSSGLAVSGISTTNSSPPIRATK